ncbi:FkbM family methyltransferase [Brachyspira intermedia]|uniref:FkbM family methyltransferase n=1 Tax=Brachyspira intermedia TaxID=84377 RepID=UPI003007DF9E
MFYIKETDRYKIFTIFGIKITLKKKIQQSYIDQIVWWIPNKKLRNSVRNIYYNLNAKIDNIDNTLTFKIDNITNSLTSKIDNITNSLTSKIDNIDNYMIKKRLNFHYPANFEYLWLNKFQSVITSNFLDLYKKLIFNLDIESIKTVNNILHKISLYIENNNILKEELFSDDELKNITLIYNNFSSSILKIDENCYSYNGMFLPKYHFESSVFYYKHNIDSIDCEYIINKNIIDVGGFIGDSALIFSKYTNKKIYTFEPVKSNFNDIQNTIELNNLNNVIAINKGLGSSKHKMEICLNGSGSSSYNYYDGLDKEKIEIIKLDDFVKENNIDIGLIKVDTEGAEKDFLLGARKTIESQKPILLISIYHSPEDFFGLKPMLESWNLNYKFRIHKPLDGQILQETLLIAEPQTRPDQTRPDQTRPDQT